MKPIILASTLFVLLFQSCKKGDEQAVAGTFKGVPVTVGNGKLWSWIEMGSGGQTKRLGLTFEEAAFTNLPAGNGHTVEYEYKPLLPVGKKTWPFTHIVVEWNPHGHPPFGIYDKPHFDMHFYLMDEAERMQIPPYETDSSGFLQYPPSGYLPISYIPIPGGVPEMGVHWADRTSPELAPVNPQPFTQTFIYGSYKGNVTFYEPMATLAFLTTTTSYTRDIPQPIKWGKEGYYPTKLSYIKTGGTIQITLYDFVYHSKS